MLVNYRSVRRASRITNHLRSAEHHVLTFAHPSQLALTLAVTNLCLLNQMAAEGETLFTVPVNTGALMLVNWISGMCRRDHYVWYF